MATLKLKKSTSLRLSQEMYDYIERLAKKENRSVNNFITTTLADAINYREPNEETKQAIEDAREERPSLKRYDNTKDLLNDLMAD